MISQPVKSQQYLNGFILSHCAFELEKAALEDLWNSWNALTRM